jgi:hypothetical protein
MSSQGTDEELLIPGRDSRRPPHPVVQYFILKVLSYITDRFLVFLDRSPGTTGVITSLASLLDFWVTQNVHGLQLVGLRWSVGSEGFTFYSRPDPFIPRESDGNAFWMGFLGFAVLWLIAFAVALFTSGFFYALNGIFGAFLQLLNFLMFMRAHGEAKAARDLVARQQAEAAEGVTFELVRDDDGRASAPPIRSCNEVAEEEEEEEGVV